MVGPHVLDTHENRVDNHIIPTSFEVFIENGIAYGTCSMFILWFCIIWIIIIYMNRL